MKNQRHFCYSARIDLSRFAIKSSLAARLSEDPKVSVDLLEAGGPGKNIIVRVPVGGVVMVPGHGKVNNWAFETVPQEELRGRRGYQPRGKALGGSSANNGQLYIRGQKEDYDEWAAAGCDGPIYHLAGTCKMGTDEMAVVDPNLSVKGMTALRVVDACVMPTLVSDNTNSPTIMIAEKAADMIKADAANSM